MNYLDGKNLSKEEALNLARKYNIGLGKDTKVQITENGKGSDYGFYSISFEEQENESNIGNMDMTKKGGHALWYMLSRDVKEQKISLNEASNKLYSF